MKKYRNVLYLTDIHQNIEWAQAVIDREDPDYIIFGGDYFDTREEKVCAGVGETAEWLLKTWEEWKDKATFLIGNHDVGYYSTWHYVQKHASIQINPNYACSGYTHSKSKKINKVLPMEFWKSTKLVEYVNDYMFTHAGVMPEFWYPYLTENEAQQKFVGKCEIVHDELPHKFDPLLGAGISRMGDQNMGGLVWADWWFDFEDLLPFPQIVGHTSDYGIHKTKGRSHCFDGMQTVYAIIQENGNVLSKYLDTRTEQQKLWLQQILF